MRKIKLGLFFLMLNTAGMVYAQESSVNQEYTGSFEDIYVLSLSSSVQDHVLYIQLIKDENKNLLESLVDNLDSTLFDLNTALPNVKNEDVIKIVCQTNKNLSDDFIKITNSCEKDSTKKICENAYALTLLCQAKQTK